LPWNNVVLAKRWLLILGLCGLTPGCALRNVTQTLIVEPIEYCTDWEQGKFFHQNRVIAEAAWQRNAAAHRGEAISPDFREGYVDGFADYLDHGGPESPPPIPPRRYWRTEYRNPPGDAAVQQWFAGFHAGASDAQASGIRDVRTVPASETLATTPPPPPPPVPSGPVVVPDSARKSAPPRQEVAHEPSQQSR
jgi:hypothetical protein